MTASRLSTRLADLENRIGTISRPICRCTECKRERIHEASAPRSLAELIAAHEGEPEQSRDERLGELRAEQTELQTQSFNPRCKRLADRVLWRDFRLEHNSYELRQWEILVAHPEIEWGSRELHELMTRRDAIRDDDVERI